MNDSVNDLQRPRFTPTTNAMMTPTTRAIAANRVATQGDFHDGSDYGSDLDEDALEELLSNSESQPLTQPLVLESIEEYNPLPRAAHLPRSPTTSVYKQPRSIWVDEDGVQFEVLARHGPLREPSVEVEYDQSNRITFSPTRTSNRSSGPGRQKSASLQPEDPNINDERSPLQRFRTKPKKPMSVTDLVSPAWCELQYWYSLTKYGKVKATPAMKQGSSVHKVLEEQVHKAVPVEVVTREDMFGLRIWNIIQGLRTLRATGMTREFEVWAEIEGQVVNGVIDELSYTCPDPDLEDGTKNTTSKKGKKEKPLPANQKTMAEFLATTNSPTLESPSQPTPSSSSTTAKDQKTVYLTDVKTRASRSVPSTEVALRPTYMQLSLYKQMLTLLASNSVSSSSVFSRYNINPDTTFSDVFIAELGNLDPTTPDDTASTNTAQDPVDEILAHNNPSLLWTLMISEFALTIPVSRPQVGISDILRAEFRAQGTGEVIGAKTFVYDEQKVGAYVRDEMGWWRGERATRGVDVEEAFKCRICAFADGCAWRTEKVEQGLQKARMRREERRVSAV